MSNLVNIMCIGAKKCGTSWLYYLLQQHPQIISESIEVIWPAISSTSCT